MVNYIEFAEGLASLRQNDEDSPDADAALHILAETIILHRMWLRSNLKET